MIRLLCINSQTVYHSSGKWSTGENLSEGKVYSASDEIYTHVNNKKDCYFIPELNQLKLVIRFVRLDDWDETESIIDKEEVPALNS